MGFYFGIKTMISLGIRKLEVRDAGGELRGRTPSLFRAGEAGDIFNSIHGGN